MNSNRPPSVCQLNPGTDNGQPRGRGKLPPFGDIESARCVLRVAGTRQPPPRDVVDRLPPEWGEAALLAAEDGLDGIATWLKVILVRYRSDPNRFGSIKQALDDAR